MTIIEFEYKFQEISDYITTHLEEDYDESFIFKMEEDGDFENYDSIFQDLFNTYCYISNEDDAMLWVDNNVRIYKKLIEVVKEYEHYNFGEQYTDLTDAKKSINMYVYIVGKELLQKIMKQQYDEKINKVLDEKLKNNEVKLVDKIKSHLQK